MSSQKTSSSRSARLIRSVVKRRGASSLPPGTSRHFSRYFCRLTATQWLRPQKDATTARIFPDSPLALLARAVGQRDRRFFRQDQEGKALLDVEPHLLGVVLEVAEREVLADRQLEVAAALGDHQATVDTRRPDDVAVDQALDVAEDRVALIGAGREIAVELVVQHHR